MRSAFLSLGLSILLLPSARAEAQAPPFRTEYELHQRIQATMTLTVVHPRGRTQEWLIIAPRPPELPWQRNTHVRVEVLGRGPAKAVGQIQGDHLLARIDGHRSRRLRLRVTLTADLYRSQLVPLRPGEKAAPVRPLPDPMRQLTVRAHPGANYEDKAFREYLRKHHLLRGPNESRFDFAHRAFRTLGKLLTYEHVQDSRGAEHVCRTGRSDCGGLANMFVATMRANDIPASCLPGRWAISANERNHAQCHVKSMFYEPHLGWVYVDQNGGVAQGSKGKEIGYQNFGNDRGMFLTFALPIHDAINVPGFGKVPLNGMHQGVIVRVRGQGPKAVRRLQTLWQVERQDVKSTP